MKTKLYTKLTNFFFRSCLMLVNQSLHNTPGILLFKTKSVSVNSTVNKDFFCSVD